jgi:hypothetical protein
VATINQQLAAAKQAPLPVADQLAVAGAYVAQLADHPTVAVVADKLRLGWRDDIVTGKEAVLAILARAAPDLLHAALAKAIEGQGQRGGAMPAAARHERIAALEQRLRELELLEEACILRAAGAGQELLRRPDANPAAVLGLAVA